MKHASSLLLAAGLVAAQTSTVVDVLLPMLDVQEVEGSVVSAGPTATTYLITCPTDTLPEDCGIPPGGFEVFSGSSTWGYSYTAADEYTMFSDCTLDPAANIADCSGGVISQELTSTVTATLSDYSDLIMPVTITAGVEKLSAATGPSDSEAVTTGPSNTGVTTPAPTPTTSGAPADNSGDNSNGSDESTDQTTSTSTGGVARITQNAAVLGAAALVGGAMMM